MIEITEKSTVYVDSNIFIYFIEAAPEHAERAAALFEHVAKVGARIVTSELTEAECLYKPSLNGDDRLVSTYQLLFGNTQEVSLTHIDGSIFKRAAIAGGALGLKLLDAVHYLSALEADCDVFVTCDKQFRTGPSMRVVCL